MSDLINRIAEVAGPPVASWICHEFGGQTVKVPRSATRMSSKWGDKIAWTEDLHLHNEMCLLVNRVKVACPGLMKDIARMGGAPEIVWWDLRTTTMFGVFLRAKLKGMRELPGMSLDDKEFTDWLLTGRSMTFADLTAEERQMIEAHRAAKGHA